jgi:hypothetical protein
MARSPNHCCHGKATMRSPCIVFHLHVTVNNINLVNVAIQIQQWMHFALLLSYKTFVIAFNNMQVRRTSSSVGYFRLILPNLGIFGKISIKVSSIKFYENTSSGSRADTGGQTDTTKLIGAFRDLTKECIVTM